jgi:hypothetical protein
MLSRAIVGVRDGRNASAVREGQDRRMEEHVLLLGRHEARGYDGGFTGVLKWTLDREGQDFAFVVGLAEDRGFLLIPRKWNARSIYFPHDNERLAAIKAAIGSTLPPYICCICSAGGIRFANSPVPSQ